MQKPRTLLACLTKVERDLFFPAPLYDELKSIVPDFHVIDPLAHDSRHLSTQIASINPDILVGAWKTPMLPPELPPRLKYVCYLTGSVKTLVTRPHLEGGLLLTNWGGSISRVVAECALLHILASLRRIGHWGPAMKRDGAWKNGVTAAVSLFERRVGIHGFGPVARELVRLLRPFNCTIQVFAPDVDHAYEREYGIKRASSLENLFSECDVLVELAPLIPATTGIIGENLLRLLAPGSVFVNVGRGAVVDEEALVRVASEGKITIGLDVYAHEPLAPDHPLRSLPNVFLTPHIGGPTADRYPDATELALRNLRAYTSGLPLEALVTPEVYDRST